MYLSIYCINKGWRIFWIFIRYLSGHGCDRGVWKEKFGGFFGVLLGRFMTGNGCGGVVLDKDGV